MTVNDLPVDALPDAERVVVYIDGFNFYHGLMAKKWGMYRWLDYRKLVEQTVVLASQELIEVKYFTTRVTHKPLAMKRQAVYLNALDQRGGLTMIEGEFEQRGVKCQRCDQWYKRPQEKRTDVNIATHLVADACHDVMDVAVLVCADSDLVPAAEFVKAKGKKLVLFDPPRRHSDDLANLAHHHLHFSRSALNQALLPNPVEIEKKRGKVRRFHMPDHWDRAT